MTPGSEIRYGVTKSRSVSGIQDEHLGSYFRELRTNFFWSKILKFFDADPGSGIFLIRDRGWTELGSRIWDKHLGSATLPHPQGIISFCYHPDSLGPIPFFSSIFSGDHLFLSVLIQTPWGPYPVHIFREPYLIVIIQTPWGSYLFSSIYSGNISYCYHPGSLGPLPFFRPYFQGTISYCYHPDSLGPTPFFIHILREPSLSVLIQIPWALTFFCPPYSQGTISFFLFLSRLFVGWGPYLFSHPYFQETTSYFYHPDALGPVLFFQTYSQGTISYCYHRDSCGPYLFSHPYSQISGTISYYYHPYSLGPELFIIHSLRGPSLIIIILSPWGRYLFIIHIFRGVSLIT